MEGKHGILTEGAQIHSILVYNNFPLISSFGIFSFDGFLDGFLDDFAKFRHS